jgi:hypothetical protein
MLNIFDGIILGIMEIFETVISKDPCDKCLVKACCKTDCNDKQSMDIFIFPHASLRDKKLAAWLVIWSVFVGGLMLSIAIFKSTISVTIT